MNSQSYADQLARYAAAMARGSTESLTHELAEGSSPHDVEMFAEDNRLKRVDGLLAQLETMTDVFVASTPAPSTTLRSFVDQYVRTVPMAPYEKGDAAIFLRWLSTVQILTPLQADHVSWNIARLSLEELGRSDRGAHVRFQELATVSLVLGEELEDNANIRIYPNPVHAFARLRTRTLLGPDENVPADVVLVVTGNAIRTVALDPQCRETFAAMISGGLMTLAEAGELFSDMPPKELTEFLQDLAAVGVVAFG